MAPLRIVVVGGGFGGLEALFNLRSRLGRQADFTLVSNQDHFAFKPNTIYIPFGKDPQDLRVPLADACRKKHINFVKAKVDAVDLKGKKVQTKDVSIPYDHLILATGASMRPEELPGLSQHANTIWTVDEMLRLRTAFSQLVEKARQDQAQRVLFLVPPNNKCSGPLYEMVFMLDTWLRRQGQRGRVSIGFATYEAHFIQAFGPRLHEYVDLEFRNRGVQGFVNKSATKVEKSRVDFTDGTSLDHDLLVAFPAYVASTRFPNLPSDDRGFIATDAKTRQVQGHPDIYAVGDGGDFPVKQAFLAFLQGDAAAEHLASRILGGESPRGFDPVSMCIMEQYDKATFAQVPLRTTGRADLPIEVDPLHHDQYRVGTGRVWQAGKKMLGAVITQRFRVGEPFHAGPSWSTMEAGLNVMKQVLTT